MWLYVLIIFTEIFKSSPETTLRAVMILQIILLFLSSLIFVKILRRFFTDEIVFAGGLIFTVFVYFQYLNGMETPLMILIFLSLFYFILKSGIFIKRSVKKEFTAGILLGLLMLARLDMVFLCDCFLYLVLL
ncbi:MAG: glycosyltransferase family 39 protein [Ignavibacteria bacterium]